MSIFPWTLSPAALLLAAAVLYPDNSRSIEARISFAESGFLYIRPGNSGTRPQDLVGSHFFNLDCPLPIANPDESTVNYLVYYNEDGEMIGRKPDSVHKSYVIKTTKKGDDIYIKLELDLGDSRSAAERNAGPAEVHFISTKEAAAAENEIKHGHFDTSIVTKYIVEIQDQDVLKRMAANIRDDGGTGDINANNKEYGGGVGAAGEVSAKEGDVSVPGSGEGASIDLTNEGSITYHSHPSGTRGDGVLTPEKEKELRLTTGDTGGISNSSGGSAFMQGPSRNDEKAARGTCYVFGMRLGVIYIYDRAGVIATLPLKFAKPVN